jgi:WD40 repeat protein
MSGDGRFLVSFTWASVSKVWELSDGSLIGRLPVAAGSAGFSPDGTRLLTDSAGSCMVYECAAGVCRPLVLPRPQIHTPQSDSLTSTFVLHPHAPFLLHLHNGDAVLTDAAAMRSVRRWPVKAATAQFSGDGRWMYIAGNLFSRLPLEENADGSWSAGIPQVMDSGSSGHRFITTASTPDGSVAAALCSGQSIHVYGGTIETGKVRRAVTGTDSISLHSSGALLADSTRNGPVRLLRLPGGEEAGSWPITGEWPVHQFSPDGKFLAWSDGRGLHAIHAESRAPAWTSSIAANGALGTFFHFDPSGRWLIISDEPGVIRLLDAATGQPAVTLQRGRETTSVHMAMNAAGSMLVDLDFRTQTLWRWDLHTLRTELRARGLDWSTAALPPPLPDKAPELRGVLLNLPGLTGP